MHVFVTGGTGQTGPAIITELLHAGHRVTGLARTPSAESRLRALGASVLAGSMQDLDVLTIGADGADGVIHMAVSGGFSDPEAITRAEVRAISALGEALVGTGKPLLTTSGTLVVPPGRLAREDDVPNPRDARSIGQLRIPGEQACLSFASRGVRAVVVRLAPTVHGPQDHGFIPMLIATARARGVSAYVGEGSNRWPAVNRLDAAALYRLALQTAPAGSIVHAVGESAVPFRTIAEEIGRRLGVPAASISEQEAAEHYASPFMARVYAADAPASSDRTRQLLGWEPAHPTLLEDLGEGDYFAQPVQPPLRQAR